VFLNLFLFERMSLIYKDTATVEHLELKTHLWQVEQDVLALKTAAKKTPDAPVAIKKTDSSKQ
jgi:hypothetical protein